MNISAHSFQKASMCFTPLSPFSAPFSFSSAMTSVKNSHVQPTNYCKSNHLYNEHQTKKSNNEEVHHKKNIGTTKNTGAKGSILKRVRSIFNFHKTNEATNKKASMSSASFSHNDINPIKNLSTRRSLDMPDDALFFKAKIKESTFVNNDKSILTPTKVMRKSSSIRSIINPFNHNLSGLFKKNESLYTPSKHGVLQRPLNRDENKVVMDTVLKGALDKIYANDASAIVHMQETMKDTRIDFASMMKSGLAKSCIRLVSQHQTPESGAAFEKEVRKLAYDMGFGMIEKGETVFACEDGNAAIIPFVMAGQSKLDSRLHGKNDRAIDYINATISAEILKVIGEDPDAIIEKIMNLGKEHLVAER